MNEITVTDLGGTPPGSRPRSRVLQHYQMITGARTRGWSWSEIGAALGLSSDAVRQSYARVQRAVRAGRIDPEALARASAPTRPRPPPAPSAPAREEQPAWQGWKTLGKQEST